MLLHILLATPLFTTVEILTGNIHNLFYKPRLCTLIFFVCLLIICGETLQRLGRKVHARFDRSKLDVFLALRNYFCILVCQARECNVSIID